MTPNMKPQLVPNQTPGSGKKKEAKEPFDVKKEIEKFKNEFKELSFPEEFDKSLDDAQKFQVITTLKNRIVDIVKSDAQTQYSESLKAKMVQNAGEKFLGKIKTDFKNAITSLKESAKKESSLKNLESSIFQGLQTPLENKTLLNEQLSQLTQINEKRNIYIDEKTNKPKIFFAGNLDLSTTPESTRVLDIFNEATNKFREMPYEWGQGEGSKKREYDEVKETYEKARGALLDIAVSKEKPTDQGKAMTKMLEFDNALQIDQLLNTHPEVEKEFSRLGKSASAHEIAKTGLSFINTVSGKTWTNRALMAIGYGARTAAKGAAVATSMTGITFVAAPIIGGAVGYWRGKLKGKEKIETTKKDSRHGDESKAIIEKITAEIAALRTKLNEAEQKNDTSEVTKINSSIKKLAEQIKQQRQSKSEIGKFSDVTNLTKKLNDLMDNINNPKKTKKDPTTGLETNKDNDEITKERINALSMLAKRIEHTKGKIELGQVDFGDAKSFTKNQFDLINALNKAVNIREANAFIVNKETDKRIEFLLSKSAEKIKTKTDASRNEFITKHAKQGALRGAEFATAGYVFRWLGEEAGWWGHHAEHSTHTTETKTMSTTTDKEALGQYNELSKEKESETLRDSLLKTKNQEQAGIFTTEEDMLPDSLKANSVPAEDSTYTAFPDTTRVEQDTLATSQIKNTEDTSSESNIPTEKVEDAEIKVNKDAIVHKGKDSGITYAFADQMKADPELAKKLGVVDMDQLSDAKYVAKLTRDIAIKTGYMDEEGHEIRISKDGMGKIAYELRVDADGHVVVDEKTLDGNIIETHTEGTDSAKFEAQTDDGIENKGSENYEYTDGKAHHYENGHEIHYSANNGEPREVTTPWEVTQTEPKEPGDVTKVIDKLDYNNLDKLPGWDKFSKMHGNEFINAKDFTPEELKSYNLMSAEINEAVKQDEDIGKLLRNPNVKIEKILEEAHKVNAGGNFIYDVEKYNTSSSNNLDRGSEMYIKKTAGYEEVQEIATKEGYHLSSEKIQEVNKVYQTRLNKIFLPERGNNWNHWNQWMSIKDTPASKFMDAKMVGDGGSKDAMRNWLLTLQKETGVEPKGLIFREDIDHYTMRALLVAKERGIDLDRLNSPQISVPDAGGYGDLQPIGGYGNGHRNLEQDTIEERLQPIGGKQLSSENSNETESLKPIIKGKGAMETNDQNSRDDLLKPIGGKNR